MSNYLINTYETYETITDILHDIYLGDIEESDIVDFLVYLEDIGDNSYTIFNEFLRIIYSLNDLYINSSDFTNLTNIGFKTPRELIYFDIGFGDYYANTDKFDLPKIIVNSFDYEKEIFDILDIDYISELGRGANGVAYELTNGKVLKITKDNSEAYNSCIIMNNQIKKDNLVNIHYVAEIVYEEFSDMDLEKTYVIIQDKVKIDKGLIKQTYDVINKHYSNFKQWLN